MALEFPISFDDTNQFGSVSDIPVGDLTGTWSWTGALTGTEDAKEFNLFHGLFNWGWVEPFQGWNACSTPAPPTVTRRISARAY
jgi:hypothetical protein